MKKMILALVATVMVTAASAQDDNQGARRDRQFDRTEMQKQQTEAFVKKYGLNEEQSKKFQALNEKFAKTMGPGMMGGPRGGRGMRPGGGNGQRQQGQRPELTEEQKQQMEARRQERDAAMKEYDAELQQILTPEQYKAYKADQEERMKQGPRGGDRRGRRPQSTDKE